MFSPSILLALAAAVAAKPPSDSRTYAVDYFYGVGPLTEGRMDPIISPGVTSNHVHTVMGGSAFSLTMTDDTAMSSNCTNSLPKADNSNYWWPKVYFHDPNNGSFIDVDLYYAKVYYFSEPSDDETKAFPQGLRMITGDAMARAPNDKLGQLNIDAGNGTINPVQFVCGTTGADPYPQQFQGQNGIGYPDPNVGGHGVGFPAANCDGYTTPLRYDLHFPSCYNPAVNRDDYQNNMAFPSSEGATPGRQNCPKGWTHTPHVFIEVYWNTPPFANLWDPNSGKQPFVLAQGDPTGYGLHADFLSGWIEQDLQAIIDDCDAGDAGMDKCPNINSAGGVNDNSDRCNIEPADPEEKIYGVLDQLPGCNPLQWGPGEASIQTANCGGVISNTNTATSAAAPTPASSAPAKVSSGADAQSAAAGDPQASAPASHRRHTATTFATSTASAASSSEPSAGSGTGSGSQPVHHQHHHHQPKPAPTQSAGGGFLEGSGPSGSAPSGSSSGSGDAPPGVKVVTVTDCITITITEGGSAPTEAAQEAEALAPHRHWKHTPRRMEGRDGKPRL